MLVNHACQGCQLCSWQHLGCLDTQSKECGEHGMDIVFQIFRSRFDHAPQNEHHHMHFEFIDFLDDVMDRSRHGANSDETRENEET